MVLCEGVPALVLLRQCAGMGAVILLFGPNLINGTVAMELIVHQAAQRSLINLLLVA